MLTIYEILQELNETKSSDSKGTDKKSPKSKSVKGRVKTYDSIKDALAHTRAGDMWSTKSAGRVYVSTKPKWGKKSHNSSEPTSSGDLVAKGFTKGSATPSADFKSIRQHAMRTKIRHGGSTSKRIVKQYASDRMKARIKKGKSPDASDTTKEK